MSVAKPGSWLYHSEVLTDQSPEEVCSNIIREKLLEYLPQEVPYSVTQVPNGHSHTALAAFGSAGVCGSVRHQLLIRFCVFSRHVENSGMSRFLWLQVVDLWQEGEGGELDISVKLYVKKDSHMVSDVLVCLYKWYLLYMYNVKRTTYTAESILSSLSCRCSTNRGT